MQVTGEDPGVPRKPDWLVLMLLHETRRVTQSRVARGKAEPGPPVGGRSVLLEY
jgi:hypothetical protein